MSGRDCKKCGKQIPAERLQQNPFTALCWDCSPRGQKPEYPYGEPYNPRNSWETTKRELMRLMPRDALSKGALRDPLLFRNDCVKFARSRGLKSWEELKQYLLGTTSGTVSR